MLQMFLDPFGFQTRTLIDSKYLCLHLCRLAPGLRFLEAHEPGFLLVNFEKDFDRDQPVEKLLRQPPRIWDCPWLGSSRGTQAGLLSPVIINIITIIIHHPLFVFIFDF